MSINLTKEQLSQLKRKYRFQINNCKNRTDALGNPIQMKLTFDEWLDIWIQSGHIFDIGNTQGKYVMSRYNDIGNYEVGNVAIIPCGENVRQAHRGVPKNRGTTINQGIKRTDEVKQRISDAHKGLKNQKMFTPIMTPYGRFNTIQEAADYLGIRPEAIHYHKRKYPNEWYYV